MALTVMRSDKSLGIICVSVEKREGHGSSVVLECKRIIRFISHKTASKRLYSLLAARIQSMLGNAFRWAMMLLISTKRPPLDKCLYACCNKQLPEGNHPEAAVKLLGCDLRDMAEGLDARVGDDNVQTSVMLDGFLE